jgi:hypothetical protein
MHLKALPSNLNVKKTALIDAVMGARLFRRASSVAIDNTPEIEEE